MSTINDNGKLKHISCEITHQNFKQTGFGLLKTAVCLTRLILDNWSAYAAVRVIYIYIYIIFTLTLTNKLFADYVNVSRVSIFKTKIGRYLIRVGYT